VDPELDKEILLADQQQRCAEPHPDSCMDISMDLDDGGSVPGDPIECKPTINY
jgi:hypothetical protein